MRIKENLRRVGRSSGTRVLSIRRSVDVIVGGEVGVTVQRGKRRVAVRRRSPNRFGGERRRRRRKRSTVDVVLRSRRWNDRVRVPKRIVVELEGRRRLLRNRLLLPPPIRHRSRSSFWIGSSFGVGVVSSNSRRSRNLISLLLVFLHRLDGSGSFRFVNAVQVQGAVPHRIQIPSSTPPKNGSTNARFGLGILFVPKYWNIFSAS